MTDLRTNFSSALNALEVLLLEMAERAERQIAEAVESLAASDAARAAEVRAQDREIDDLYLEVEQLWHETMALHTPVAKDLRFMSLILNCSHSIERIGDQAANIAKVAEVTSGLPPRETILVHIREMASVVGPMLRVAMESLTKRNISLALRLHEMDDPVDRLNRNMYKEVAACGDDPEQLEWAVRMMLVSRALERVGDRAVDIGEQVAFLLTGEFREFPETWTGDDGG